MKWRRVAVKVAVVVSASAAIVAAVFVVAPWLEVTEQPADPPLTREAIVEEVLASFEKEDAGDGGGADGVENGASIVMAIPSPLLWVEVENPMPSPEMESPIASGTSGVEIAAAPAAGGLAEVLSPEEVTLALPEPGLELHDGPAPAGLPIQEGEAVERSTGVEATSSVQVEALLQEAVESAEAAEESPPAHTAPESVQAIEVEGMLSATGEPTAAKSETLPQRVPLEEPGSMRVAEMPLGAQKGPLDTEEAVVSVGEPLLEFSARSVSLPNAHPVEEAPDPSKGATGEETPGAGQAGLSDPRLPPESDPVLVPGTLRGVMGYRLPLVSRQELPDQVVSGVLIPAHTTYVILKPGHWELVGLSPEEVQALQAAAEKAKAEEFAARGNAESARKPESRRWRPFKLFRKRNPAVGE